ncbi:MAG: GtrA family protein [Chitinophagales bacterium]
MRKAHENTRALVLVVVDFFYQPFRKIISLQTFRYAACGGFTTLLGIVLYYIGYHFVFKKEVVHLYGRLALEPHIAADYLFALWITFPTGFYLNRFVVFQESNLKGRVQLFRYFVVTLAAVCINYFFLKLFIEGFGLYPTVAKIFTTAFVILFSYVSQRNFTFKKL